MKKLVYWCATQTQDHVCYNLRAKTRKEIFDLIESSGEPEIYSKPFKMTVFYEDAFDLLKICLSEGSVYEYPEN